MSRYLNEGAVWSAVKRIPHITMQTRQAILEALRKVPSADVAEVVRCKDCKHATFYSCKNDACYKRIICEYQIAIGDENFLCACGETRTSKEMIGED